MDPVTCFICHDYVRTPVQIDCFSCRCNDVRRVCLYCARRYLQLNTSSASRTSSLRCLTCPTTVDVSKLPSSGEGVYHRDFMLMSIDQRRDYTCPHKCGSFSGGNQCELDRHCSGEACTGRLMACRGGCGTWIPTNEEMAHMSICAHWKKCDMLNCNHWFFTPDSYETHLEEAHQHARCNHCGCFITSPASVSTRIIATSAPLRASCARARLPRMRTRSISRRNTSPQT